MRIPNSHQRPRSDENSAMTPMIDVVFLLLIFFVCASTGQLRELLLPTDLSAGAVEAQEFEAEERPLGEVWVRLRQEAGGLVAQVEGTDYSDFATLQQTLTGLAELAPEIPVILDIAPDVPLGDVIRVYDTCRAARFESIHFATDPAR